MEFPDVVTAQDMADSYSVAFQASPAHTRTQPPSNHVVHVDALPIRADIWPAWHALTLSARVYADGLYCKAGVQHGGVTCMMCSYNAEAVAGGEPWGYGVAGSGSAHDHGGIPSCANRYLMNDLARNTWGFEGT